MGPRLSGKNSRNIGRLKGCSKCFGPSANRSLHQKYCIHLQHGKKNAARNVDILVGTGREIIKAWRLARPYHFWLLGHDSNM